MNTSDKANNKIVELCEHCDVFIETDENGDALILANGQGRQTINALFDAPIDCDLGESSKGLPLDWKSIELSLPRIMAYDHRVSPLAPECRSTEARDYGLRVAIAAERAGSRVITLVDGEFKVISFENLH